MASACMIAFAQKEVLCQNSLQINIHPQDLSFLCAWRKQVYILLPSYRQSEETLKTYLDDLP